VDTVFQSDNFRLIVNGFLLTLRLTLMACAIGLVLGTILATFRVSPIRPLRAAATAYTNFMVCMPIAVWLSLWFFGFTKIGIKFSASTTEAEGFYNGLAAVALWVSAYFGEAIRSGINSVPNGQAEAARAIGLSFPGVLGSVVLPQAIRSAILPIGVVLNATYRNAAAVSILGVGDIVNVTGNLTNEFPKAEFPLFLAAFACFFVLSLLTNPLFLAIDKKLRVKR
jgi:glutamate transport system permease protein